MMLGGIGLGALAGYRKYKQSEENQSLKTRKVSPQNSGTKEKNKWILDPQVLERTAIPPNLDKL